MSEDAIERARERSAAARGRLADALGALKQRLLPRTIARNVVEATKDKAVGAAIAGTDAVRARPQVAVGVAALAALFLARKPIKRALSHDRDETDPRPARSRTGPSRKAKT